MTFETSCGSSFVDIWNTASVLIDVEQTPRNVVVEEEEGPAVSVDNDFVYHSMYKNELETEIDLLKRNPKLWGKPNNKLYIKNLTKYVTERDLEALFCSGFYGKVKVVVGHGSLRCQAFITFEDKDYAARALSANQGKCVQGRPLFIRYAMDRRRLAHIENRQEDMLQTTLLSQKFESL
jgi:hypothetical protein